MNPKFKALTAKAIVFSLIGVSAFLIMCERHDPKHEFIIKELSKKGLIAEYISAKDFAKGIPPKNFEEIAGAKYKPSYNEDPAIPPQCWIETGYGTQNACKYCHTDYLAVMKHGNNFPLGEDQILYSFPTPALNRVLWRNIIFPQELEQRLKAEGIKLPKPDDIAYVREDNWKEAYIKARTTKNTSWLNNNAEDDSWILFPALNPNHLYPFNSNNPTGDGKNGYIDEEGFVRDEYENYTGWRALNFFPYAIFTPLTGSVSGVYVRLSEKFMNRDGEFSIETYKRNLALLEKNIKDQNPEQKYYYGDASDIEVKKGFYPVGTEFAHPLHYVDLAADGKTFLTQNANKQTFTDYNFPGTRSKRVKEIRYMYKWREVTLEDIGADEEDEDNDSGGYEEFIGKEGQGWIENNAGWIIAGYIENRFGNLRPQTTEELIQCLGCHGNVGNTVDAIWSFQRKLPEELGWKEMNYGQYDSKNPQFTKLQDYAYSNTGMGELGYFYYTVVGADLYGVMPEEIKNELIRYSETNNLIEKLELKHSIKNIFDDEALKFLGQIDRKSRLLERQKIMRNYAENSAYLYYSEEDDTYFIKGNIFYPSIATMKNNIFQYRKIVLDQSFNLGKDVFGNQNEQVPFTFRSDGNVRDEEMEIIPAGKVITSRPYNSEGVGITPTGIVLVNNTGKPVDENGKVVDLENESEKAVGHISTGGTFDMMYNPILSGIPFKPKR
ncbi:MAG: hypothetical protein KGZ97_13250 [Bacteroidetes bacterium]|nr:hypothetical protein [Bacteroidota bacterium]